MKKKSDEYNIEKGHEGFSRAYWEENYQDPDSMDGIGNLDHHLGYIKNLFAIEFVDISSVIDLGFGLGHFMKAFVKEFMPYKVMGIEPSEDAFLKIDKKDLQEIKSTKVKLEKIDLVSWAQKEFSGWNRFDFGICTSVLQYLSREEIEIVAPVIAKRVKYLYLSVPTDLELDRQKEEVEFFDQYAIRRSRAEYYELLSPHFTFISARVLESKSFFSEESSSFTDLLFRF